MFTLFDAFLIAAAAFALGVTWRVQSEINYLDGLLRELQELKKRQ